MRMKKGIIFALGTVVGGALGSVTTWYGLKTVLETKYEQLAKEEIESVKETYREKYENDRNSPSQNASVTHQEPRRAILGTGDDEEVVSDEKMAQKSNKRSREHTDYSKIAKTYGDENAEKSGDTGVEVEEEQEELKETKPYVITPQEFEHSQNEKVYMQYYLDGTLTDDFGEPVQPSDYVGDLIIEDCFDEDSPEPDLVFARDPKLKIDYEISRVLARYPEATGERMED